MTFTLKAQSLFFLSFQTFVKVQLINRYADDCHDTSFLGGWPAISTFYIVLYGLLFINHIIFSALFSLIIVFKWLMSNKLIFIVK